jgi:hypothetical protein
MSISTVRPPVALSLLAVLESAAPHAETANVATQKAATSGNVRTSYLVSAAVGTGDGRLA